MLPRFASALVQGVEPWRSLAIRSLRSSIWAACLIAVCGTVLAPTIVTTSYGAAYHASAVPLQLLIWMIPLATLNGHFRCTLVASGQQRVEFKAAAASAVLTLTLALWLGQGAGSTGAAAALLIGGVVYTIATAMSVQKLVGTLRPARLVSAPVATCLLCLAMGIAAAQVLGEVMGGAVALVAYTLMALNLSAELGHLALGWLRR
jgi:O-antigen/teichoic acid export membrane protein